MSLTEGISLTTIPTPETTHASIETYMGASDTRIFNRFDTAIEHSNNFLSQVSDYMTQMQEIVAEIEEPDLGVSLGQQPLSYYFFPSWDLVSPTITYETYAQPTKSNLTAVDLPSLTVPDIEPYLDPSHVLAVGDQLHDPLVAESLWEIILSELASPSTGIPTSVENDIWLRDHERLLQEMKDSKDRIAADWSKRGFKLPNGALVNALAQAEVAFTHQRAQLSRDAAIKQADMTLQFRQFVMQQGLALESFYVDWITKIYSIEIQVAQTLLQQAQILANVTIARADTQMKYNTYVLDSFRADIDLWGQQIKNMLARAEMLIRNFEAKTRGYEARSNATVAIAGVDVSAQNNAAQMMLNQANFYMNQAKVNLDARNQEVALKLEAARGGAQVAAQLGAGIFAGASASLMLQGQVGLSESTSRGISFSETQDIT